MSEQNSRQMAPAPNAPRLKLGGLGRLGALDPSAIAKAEAALKNLSGNFAQWLRDEVAKLDAARQTVRAEGMTPENMQALYMRAHDLKGLGTTYGYPLITRIAASLCVLTGDAGKRMSAPLALVEAHIDAVQAAVRDDMKTEEHPVAARLAETLEAQVAAA